MDEQINIAKYLVYVLRVFAQKKGLYVSDAYEYLNKYKGIEFLTNNYGYEHTLSIDEIVDDVTKICANNGGDIK